MSLKGKIITKCEEKRMRKSPVFCPTVKKNVVVLDLNGMNRVIIPNDDIGHRPNRLLTFFLTFPK